MEENKSTITFELKNDLNYMTHLRNSAITILNDIVNADLNPDLTECDFGQKIYFEAYNKSIDNLIKILETMKVEVFENEKYNS